MSSRATPQFIEERRERARREYGAVMRDWVRYYAEIIAAQNPEFKPTRAFCREVKKEIENIRKQEALLG